MKTNNRDKYEMVRRLNPLRLLEHHANALCFITLVVTGLSQKYHNHSWAEGLIEAVGGIDSIRVLHRYTAVAFVAVYILHVAVGAYGLLILKWQPSMLVNKKDFTDAIENLRYYFGTASHPARCDRYDYKQKFEYWGVVAGGALIITTGLLLWFPTEIFQLLPFLPGQIIPAAKAAHTNEAMLAFLVIVTWHIYNAIFSPEVFPLDTVILTGKISKARMKHEHPLEYERLFGLIEEEETDQSNIAGDEEKASASAPPAKNEE